MKNFEDRLAIITGAGAGMGRELAVQLSAAGANLALCDVHADALAETVALCDERPRVSTHIADVSDEGQLETVRDEMLAAHETDHAHLLFNNAGIAGGGSFVAGGRESWERTFDVCWKGVYLGCRVFLPLLIAADEGHVVNTSSINGFWGSLGPHVPHTSYVAAKFAVKGFTEALITDLRIHAPHVAVSLVMPGHIGTEIARNSVLLHGSEVDARVSERANEFRNSAPTTAAEAADIILDGVRRNRWRILVGEDAHPLDELVRADPEMAYEPVFVRRMHDAGVFRNVVAE
ncbi:MAG: SDR family NAD(P)-dependent oxidoreductase [Actinomycetota bacterium]|nr:SDR family NAD(P)-dependent oxidoreductase [Actinomycetota bacterium]